jgi:hypothetical protein
MQDKCVTFAPCVAAFYQRIFELHWVAFPVGYRCYDLRWFFDAFAFSELALRPEFQERKHACVTG